MEEVKKLDTYTDDRIDNSEEKVDKLKKRAEKYFSIEKGPRRTMKKKEIEGKVLFCHENGICVYFKESKDHRIKNSTVISEEEEYLILKIKE